MARKTFAFTLFAIVLLLQLVIGAVPVFTSVSVPDSATADVNFNVPFSVTGNSLTQVAIYERTVVDGKSVFNKFTSQACSGNSCSGTFTIKFSVAGSHQVYLAAVDSVKTIGSYSKIITINAANCGAQLGQSCTVGTGACQRTGTYVCNAQNNGVVCNAVAGTPTSETCNGIDDNCDGTVDNGGNALCSDSLYCNGNEVCSGISGCTAGTAVSCSGNNLPSIGTCTNNPDNNPRTWDFFAGFISSCNEATDSCTTGTTAVTSSCNTSCGGCVQNSDCLPSTCSQTFNDYCSGLKLVEYDSDRVRDSTTVSDSASNTCNTGDCSCTSNAVSCNAPSTSSYCVLGICGAECEVSGDCADKCVGNVYSYSGSCSAGCSCSYNTQDCDLSDGWYNTSTTQWINDTICNQRKQLLQEYRDYSCSLPSGCSYSTTSNRWINTSEITAKNNGAVCDDGFYCTVSDVCTAGVCGGSARSCSGSNLAAIGTCTNDPDNNPKTWDYFAGFTSVCNEGTDSCTTGTVSVTSTCNKATCLAQCEVSGDCLPSTCSVKYNDSCVSGKLKDYNSDGILNYRFINNSVSNTCLSSCSCTANSVSCSEPSSTTTCVKGQCGATCASSSDCNSYCSGSVYYYSGSCSGSCSCSFASTDCALSNGWYNSSVTQWVSTGDCTEKQQREQKYRTYTCSAGCTYTNTSTQWIDTGSVRNKANGLSCSDGTFCNGAETCQAGVCTAGTAVSCVANNIAPLATCDNIPDSIHATWDFSSGFTSTCDEVNDMCTSGAASITHTCSKTSCSAQCETAGDCGNTCINNVYYTSGSCSGTCSCSYSSSDNCTAKNDWYDTLSDRVWVSTGQCTEKEQKEQEHRTYTCGSGCVHSVDSTRWIDTGATRSKTDGTTCNDGLFCTQTDTCSSGTCLGTGNTCSPFNIGAISTCTYTPDNKSNTLDVFSGFTSVCNEGTDTCSSGSITITSNCNKATCGAQCESSSDCSASTCSVNYNDACNGTKLKDYNNNGLNDFVQVSNSTANSCTLSTCGCTANTVNCFAPVATTHCVKGQCGATCAVDSDCIVTDCSAGNICEIGHIYKKYDSVANTCSASCGCSENSCSGFTELYNVSCNSIPEYALTIPSQDVVQYSYTMLNLKAIPYFGDFDDDPLWISAVSNSTYLKVKMNNATSYANLSSNVSGSYSVIFTAHDGFGGVVSSTPILVTVSRVNLGAPVVSGINLNRSVVYRNTNFTFSYNYTDVDNDAITSYVYRLYKNKVLQYNKSNTNIVNNNISWKKADNLTVSLRVCDWSRCSGWNNKTITVADTEMIVTSIYLKPNATVYNNNTLYTCYAKYYDADGDVAGYVDTSHKYVTLIRFKIIKNNLVYFNNDPTITTSNSTQNASYNFSSTSPNDNISCTAYFYKYWGNFSVINPYFNSKSTANVTVLNRAPHIDKIDVSGRNYNDSTNSTFKNSRRVDLTNYVNHTFQVALFSDYFSDPDGYWDMDRYSNLSYTYTDSRTGKTAGFFNCTTWVNGSCTGYRIERIYFKSTKLENYNINVTVTDIHGAKDSVVIYVNSVDYRAAPTMSCTNQNVSDGWENMGQYICSCSNNYLDETDTIKLSNMNVGRNAGNPAVSVNEFNMSVVLMNYTTYSGTTYTGNSNNPFNKTTSTKYAWYPLWKNTNKTYNFNVTCATPKGKVWKSVKVNVSEGYYQFYNSRIMYWDGANVTGYVMNYSNAGIMPSEPIYNVSACINSFGILNVDSDTMMRRLFNTNDLSFIRPNNDYWTGIGVNKTGYVDQNSRDYNRLNIRIDDFMTRYNALQEGVDIQKYCIDIWYYDNYRMNCTKYNVSQCAHRNLTNPLRSSYATDYSVVIKKII